MLGRVKISLHGLNLHKAPTIMLSHKIDIFDLKRQEKELEFCILLSDKAKAINLLKDNGFKDFKMVDSGILSFFTKEKITLLLCMIVTLCLILLASGLVWRIEINGNIVVSDSEVIKALNDFGIDYFKPKGNIRLDKLENFICNSLENVNFAAVQIVGSSIIVNIYEKDIAPPLVDYNKKSDIIATKDGVVTRIFVVSGTCMVKVGDSVRENQVLIRGEKTFSDGATKEVRAVGEVYASVKVESEQEIPLMSQVKKPSGRKISRTNIVILNKTYQSFIKNPYQHFIISAKSFDLNMFGIRFETDEIFECTIENVKIDIEQEKVFLKERAIAQASDNLVFDKIDDIECIFEESETILKAKVRLYGQIKISENA